MRSFDFKTEYGKLLTPDIVNYITRIHEYKGRQNPLISEKEHTLSELLTIAKIQSTEASNKIEGIITTDDRIKKIVNEKTMPKTSDEKEIAGYRDVLTTIHENYEYIPPRPNHILQMHRDLYKFSGKTIGGNYKTTDNHISEEQADGSKVVRFTPVPASQAPEMLTCLCTAFNEAIDTQDMDPLILIPMFVLDFLCIHPFAGGNGRMSRLLTLLLLYKSGYYVGKYISIEKLMSDTREAYYEALQESSVAWHAGNNDYAPFVSYMLAVILAAYREFDQRISLVVAKGISKPERVQMTIKDHLGKITKAEITEKCPGISQITIQRALADMLQKNEIIKIGSGRYTAYVWNGD